MDFFTFLALQVSRPPPSPGELDEPSLVSPELEDREPTDPDRYVVCLPTSALSFFLPHLPFLLQPSPPYPHPPPFCTRLNCC